jgi:hypothetical protein
MNKAPKDSLLPLKVLVTVGAIAVLALRIFLPTLRIDAVSLGLIGVALLPWLSPLIKSAKLPGGLEIEFQDVKNAAEKITAGEATTLLVAPSSPTPTYLDIAEQDPNLALVALRIEIEKRLQRLAELADIPRSRSLTTLTRGLEERRILHPDSAGGLRDLISLGNQAAHGAPVGPEVAYSAVEYGPRVLQILDSKIAQLGGAS